MKAALYARVSTTDKDQDPEVQLIRLRRWVVELNLEIYDEYVDIASGANEKRPALDQMVKHAHQNRFKVILMVRLDRIMRSIRNLLNLHHDLEQYGVGFRCMDQSIETITPAGRLQMQILGAVAEFERELARERIKDGMAKAKEKGTRSGKPIGRPRYKIPKNVIQEAIRRLDAGEPLSRISEDLGVPRSSLRRALSKRGVVDFKSKIPSNLRGATK